MTLEEGTSEFQFVTKLNLIEGLGFNPLLAIDGISILYVVLTTLLIPICILAS